MLSYTLYLWIPFNPEGEEVAPWKHPIAHFNFDLGLTVGEKFTLKDWQTQSWGNNSYSFEVIVKNVQKFVKPSKNGDIFTIDVYSELSNTKHKEEMREILRQFNPDKFD